MDDMTKTLCLQIFNIKQSKTKSMIIRHRKSRLGTSPVVRMCLEQNKRMENMEGDKSLWDTSKQHLDQHVSANGCDHASTSVDILPIQMNLGPHNTILTNVIKQMQKCEDLIALVFAYKDEMNGIHISAASSKFANLRPHIPLQQRQPKLGDNDQTQMDEKFTKKEYSLQEQVDKALFILAVNFQIQAHEFSTRSMTSTLWGLSKAGYKGEEFYLSWLEIAIGRIRDFSPRQICQCMWSLSNKGWTGHHLEIQFFELVVQLSIIKFQQFQSIDVCMLLWSIAKNPEFIRESRVEALFRKAVNFIIQEAQQTSSQGITNILWAYGNQRFLYKDQLEEMLQTLSRQISQRRNEFCAQQVGNILWSFMRLHFYQYDVFNTLVDMATENIWDLQPLALSNILYSFSWFKFKSEGEVYQQQFSKFFIKASTIFVQQMHMFEPLQFANVVQSYASIMDPKDDDLYDACVYVIGCSYVKAISDFDKFGAFAISMVSWAYGKSSFRTVHNKQLNQFYLLVKQRIQTNPEMFTASNLITILYGICLAKFDDLQFVKLLLCYILQFNEKFKTRQIQMLKQTLDILPDGDEELDEILYLCTTQFGISLTKQNIWIDNQNKQFTQLSEEQDDQNRYQ